MNDAGDTLVQLSFALGTTIYATLEYRDLVLDLIRAGVLTEKPHEAFAIMESTGVLLNPKWLRGYTFFTQRVYAEAYLAGLLEQLGGIRGVPYLMAYITDPFIEGADLIRNEQQAAERERGLPSWMRMLEGGKGGRTGNDEQEADPGVVEKNLQAGSGFQVQTKKMLPVLRPDSDAPTGIRPDKDIPTKENEPQGIDGAEGNSGTGRRWERGRVDVSPGGQGWEVSSLPSPPIDVPDDGELPRPEREREHGLPRRPGQGRASSSRFFQDVRQGSKVLRSEESDSLDDSEDDEITDA